MNLANLHELQLDAEPGALAAAAAFRGRLFALLKAQAGREAPDACPICLEALDPLRATDAAAAADPGSKAAVAAAAAAAAAAAGGGGGAAGGGGGGSAEPAARDGAAPAAGDGGGAAPAPEDDDGGAARDQARGAAAAGDAASKAGRVLMLACGHALHHGCYFEWEARGEDASCPTCRTQVPLY